MIAISSLTKYYGEQTLFEGVSLHLNKEQVYGVVGANGSGKSTMLKLIAGLEEPDAGTSVRRRGIVVSFLPQHPLGDERTPLDRRARSRAGGAS